MEVFAEFVKAFDVWWKLVEKRRNKLSMIGNAVGAVVCAPTPVLLAPS
jgi:hypothetical protein